MPGYQSATLTVQAINDRLTRQFGDESGVQITPADVYHWVNDGQREILTRNQTLKAKASTDLVAGTKDYTIPTGVLKVASLHVNFQPVDYLSFQEAEEYILENDPQRTNTGQPVIWYEWGGTYSFWPTPDTSISGGIVIRYIQAPVVVAAMTDLLTIPDTEFNLLLQYCMTQAYEMDEDWNASQVKSGQFETGLMAASEANADTSVKYYPTITVLPEDM